MVANYISAVCCLGSCSRALFSSSAAKHYEVNGSTAADLHPPSWPDSSALATASVSAMAPRAVLIRMAPFFILPITSSLNIPLQLAQEA